jgi:alpha,alpha-trehalase
MTLETIETTNIVPIDLNSLFYKIERNIAKLCQIKGDSIMFEKFQKKSIKRKRAINSLMWSEKMCCWSDFNMKAKRLNENNFYISCLSPLCHGIKAENYSTAVILAKHLDSLSASDCGIPYSV